MNSTRIRIVERIKDILFPANQVRFDVGRFQTVLNMINARCNNEFDMSIRGWTDRINDLRIQFDYVEWDKLTDNSLLDIFEYTNHRLYVQR